MRTKNLLMVWYLLHGLSPAVLAQEGRTLCYDLKGTWQGEHENAAGHLKKNPAHDREAAVFTISFSNEPLIVTELLEPRVSTFMDFPEDCSPWDTSRRCEHLTDQGFNRVFQTVDFVFEEIHRRGELLEAKLRIPSRAYHPSAFFWAIPSPCS